MSVYAGRVKYALIVAVALFALHRPAHATPDIPHDPPDGYIALPFENVSKVAALDWMRVAIPGTLVERLEAHPALRALHGAKLVAEGAPTIDAASVAAAATHAGATFVWTGAYARKNWKLEVVFRLWQVDAATGAATLVGESKQYGDFGKLFAMMDVAVIDLCAKAGRPVDTATQELLARAPTDDFYALTLYGRALYAMHGLGKAADLAAAEKNLTRALFIDPKFAEGHRLLAALHLQRGQPGKARGQLTYALDLRPEYYAPLAALVTIAHEAKDRVETIELATRALAIRPWDVEVRYLLGEAMWEEGDVDGAYLELGRIVAFLPDHLPARRVLVLIHASKGDGSRLAAELEEILRLDPNDEAAKLDLGAAYHAIGRDDDATAIYADIVKQHPKHLQALKFLGDLAKSRGDLPGAIAWYEQALKANRNDPRPYFLLGDAYVRAGQDKKAIRIYQAAQKFPRYLGDAHNNLGAIYYRLGRNGEALWYLKYAAARRPANAKVHYNYALALVKAHKRDIAFGEITLACQLDPEDAEIRYALGVVLLRMGRIEEAEKAFQECARLDPKHEDALHNLRLIDELRRRAQEGEVSIE